MVTKLPPELHSRASLTFLQHARKPHNKWAHKPSIYPTGLFKPQNNAYYSISNFYLFFDVIKFAYSELNFSMKRV